MAAFTNNLVKSIQYTCKQTLNINQLITRLSNESVVIYEQLGSDWFMKMIFGFVICWHSESTQLLLEKNKHAFLFTSKTRTLCL